MKSKIIPLAVACGLAASVVGAWAVPPAAGAASAGHPASLEQAVKQVQRETHGHILAADTVSRGRTQVYRIKVLRPNGRVQVMQLHSSPHPQPHAGKHDPDRGGH